MSKKLKPTVTKLSKCTEQNNNEKHVTDNIGIITSKKNLAHPVSFRLTAEDVSKLNKIISSINAVTRMKIKRSKVLQTLINVGCSIPVTRIIKELKENL
jgi:hypothetical protein